MGRRGTEEIFKWLTDLWHGVQLHESRGLQVKPTECESCTPTRMAEVEGDNKKLKRKEN